jgi:hypothetical protein
MGSFGISSKMEIKKCRNTVQRQKLDGGRMGILSSATCPMERQQLSKR